MKIEKNGYVGVRMHDLGSFEPEQLAGKLNEYGFSCGQLAIPKSIPGIASYHDVTDGLLEKIRTVFHEKAISVSVLGCYIEPVHPDKAERDKHLQNFAQGIRSAAALKAGCIGTETTTFCGGAAEWDKAFSILCHSVEFMLEKAKPFGVTIGIEPVRFHTLRSPEAAYQLMKCFRGENIGIIFDALNLLAPDGAGSQQALWRECFDAFGQDILACHIKDGAPNEERREWIEGPLGQGVLDYSGICDGLKRLGKQVPLLREGFLEAHAQTELQYLNEIYIGGVRG
ncbi:MAG: sugar phosphate isomerase/epimerase [Oscillospiraceae bacterium]|nr:sugar phosphate isomerase/epimerase [Oscillospiraceae bacterium]